MLFCCVRATFRVVYIYIYMYSYMVAYMHIIYIYDICARLLCVAFTYYRNSIVSEHLGISNKGLYIIIFYLLPPIPKDCFSQVDCKDSKDGWWWWW